MTGEGPTPTAPAHSAKPAALGLGSCHRSVPARRSFVTGAGLDRRRHAEFAAGSCLCAAEQGPSRTPTGCSPLALPPPSPMPEPTNVGTILEGPAGRGSSHQLTNLATPEWIWLSVMSRVQERRRAEGRKKGEGGGERRGNEGEGPAPPSLQLTGLPVGCSSGGVGGGKERQRR